MTLKTFTDTVVNTMLTAGANLILIAQYHNNPKVEKLRKRTCRGTKTIPGCVNYNPDRDQCKKCGCIIEAKSKALTNYNPLKGMRAEITHCPEGFWDDKETADYYKNLP